MEKEKKRNRLVFWGIQLLIFLFLIVFLTRVFPLVPFDGDDWSYIGSMRLPIPEWGVWNPTRVLPETLMPLTGYIGAYLIYPFTGKYVQSLTLASAIVYSLFVLLMLIMFYRALRKRLKASFNAAVTSEVLFFLSLFLLFKDTNQASYDLLWAVDLACVFFYIIPGLLNVGLMLYFEGEGNISQQFLKYSNLKRGILILALYFALFSCTQLNIILAAYSFIYICIEFFKQLRSLNLIQNIVQTIKQTWLYFTILVVWLISVIFDLNGGRASNVSGLPNEHGMAKVADTLSHFWMLFKFQSKLFLIISALVVICAVVIFVRSDGLNIASNNMLLRQLIICLGIMLISFCYLMIAYIKAGPQYAGRPDATWPIWIMIVLLANFAFNGLLARYDVVKSLSPLLLVLLGLVMLNVNYLPIIRNNDAGHSAQTMVNVDNYIINKVVAADHSGKSEVTVKVPKDAANTNPKNTASNWPHSYDMEQWLQNTLYSHGLIRTRIKIKFVPTYQMNHKFYENTAHEQKARPTE